MVVHMNITSKYAERLAKLDDLHFSIQKISGFTVEQLLNMFMAGYEMSAPKYEAISQLMPEDIGTEKKEATTMQVTYNGFTGGLLKLERVSRDKSDVPIGIKFDQLPFDLSIYDSQKNVTHSFAGVKLEDVKFLGGAVTFSG